MNNNAVLYALTVFLWGFTWYAITFQLGIVHPLLSIAYRFGLAAIVLFIYMALRGRLKHARFTRKQHAWIALQGLLLFCLDYWLNYIGTSYITSGLVSVVFSTVVIMNICNQRIFFKISVKPQVIFGSILGLVGICLVFWPEIGKLHFEDSTFKGILIILAATYTASLGSMVALRNTHDHIPVMECNSFGMLYGAAFSFLLAFLSGAPLAFEFTASYILALLYLSIFGSAIAFGTYLTLMRNIGADKASYAGILLPIVALAVSTLLEGYVWTFASLIGVLLTLLGNVIAMTNKKTLLLIKQKLT